MKTSKKYFLLATPLLLAAVPCGIAQAAPGFTYLDDGEAGGYDVTTQVKTLPVECILNEQDNGDAYHLKITANAIDLSLVKGTTDGQLVHYGRGMAPGPLVIQRRGPRWRVIAEKRVLFEADDDTFMEGKVGFKGGVSGSKVQPTEEITFADDFMRVASDVAIAAAKEDPRQGVKITTVQNTETVWQNLVGNWSTTGLTENPDAQVAQSANPFVFGASAKGENLSVAGKPFWDDYSAEVSVKPEGAKAVGIAAYVQDAKNYLLLHWSEDGQIELRGIVDGKVRVLDKAELPYEQKQWYRLRFSAANGWVRGYIDDAEMVRTRSGLLGRGQVGLYVDVADAGKPAETVTTTAKTPEAGTEPSAVFDDVSVNSINDFADDFTAPVPGRWKPVSGTWKFSQALEPATMAGSYSVMGEGTWTNYTASTTITLPASTGAGVLLHHRAGQGTYVLRFAGSKAALPYAGKVQIVKMAPGKTIVLEEVPVGARFDNKTTVWDFSGENGYLKAQVDGVRIVDAFDDGLDAGRPGVFAIGDAKTKATPKFLSYSVEFPHPHATWAKVPEIFTVGQQPLTMGAWSTPEGAWVPLTPMAGNATVKPISDSGDTKTFWHKGAFWGDGAVRFKLPALTAAQKLNLIFGDLNRAPINLGLQADGQALKATLVRTAGTTSTELAKGSLTLDGKMEGQVVEVARRGRFLIVRAGENKQKLLAAKVTS